jgi:hypothetical protein
MSDMITERLEPRLGSPMNQTRSSRAAVFCRLAAYTLSIPLTLIFLVLFLTLLLRHTLPVASLTLKLGTAVLDILILIVSLPWHAQNPRYAH